MQLPDTRASLILRLPDAADAAAWEEFLAIYQPMIYRLALRRGLQHNDALDLVQEVLLAVSKSVERWVPDPSRGRFRDWLFRIARNLVLNFLTRPKHRPVAGNNEHLDLCPDENSAESRLIDREYRQEVFRWSAEHVRQQVTPRTWRAFWMSTVEEESIAAVAEELDMTVGSVYIARSRVLAKLRERAEEFSRVAELNREAAGGGMHR